MSPSAVSGAALQAALLDLLEGAVVACDEQGQLIYANAAAGLMWEIDDWQAETNAAALLAFADAAGQALATPEHPLRRAQAGETLSGERFTVLTGRGGLRRVHVSARPLAGTAGLGAVIEVAPQLESESEAALRTHVSDFEILSEVSRELADVSDAEAAASIVCTVATGCTGAIAVFLWEHEKHALILRGQEGVLSGQPLRRLTDHVRGGAVRAIADARTRIERDEAMPTLVEELGVPVGTSWHEPLRTGARTSGVLSIVWPGVLGDLARPGWLIGELAHHAATALERAYLVRRLNEAARTDPLTGLANRRVWDERLSYELARARREDSPISLILIDLDRFKAYNDRYGHPQGDVLLRECAAALAPQLRATDLFARIGGEEFAVLLPSCPLEDACLVADRLRQAVPYEQTCSLGVTTWDGNASAVELYAAADAALYRAKDTGRNRYVVGHLNPVPEASLGS